MAANRSAHPVRRGVTLLELLVVVFILMLLAAIAVPAMRPALESRRIREAARSINVYFGSARVRAKETGRPVGVLIERSRVQPEAASVLRQVEVPAPYSGDTLDAVVKVLDCTYLTPTQHTPPPPDFDLAKYWADGSVILKVLVRPGDLSNGLVRRADLIRLAGQGPLFTIIDGGTPKDFPLDANGFIDFAQGTDTSSPLDGLVDNFLLTLRLEPNQAGSARLDVDYLTSLALANATAGAMLTNPGSIVPWTRADATTLPNNSASPPWIGASRVPFEIIRQPQPSSAPPLQLPAGTVIDLYDSGTNSVLFEVNNGPIVVMFAAGGSIQGLFGATVDPNDPIYLLVGRADHLPLNAGPALGNRGPPQTDLPDPQAIDADPQNPERRLRNWRNPSNLWVTLNPQTGFVATMENRVVDESLLPATVLPKPPFNYNARTAAPASIPTHRLWGLGNARGLARTARSMGGR